MILKEIIIVIVLTAITLSLFYLIKRFILPRFKIKRMYILIAIAVVTLVPIVFRNYMTKSPILPLVQMVLFPIAILLYMETYRMEKEEKIKKKNIIKPKAKPNRVKHKETEE